jgi:dipeptidyl aminopeptidase/acylaminoacyl peptidase
VAVTEDGRVVVLDTTSGREVRTLATGASAVPSIAVTPDGSRVFFHRATTQPPGCETHEVVSVATDGGPVEVVAADALYPAVSPDGEMLAFLSSAGRCAEASSLVVQAADQDGVESSGRSWAVTEPNQSLALLSWAPDSRNLAFVFVDGNTSSTQELDTATAASLSDARPLAVPVTAGWGYLGTTGEFGAVRNGRAVALDPDTGATRRDLFAFDPELEIGRIASDSSGRHFLFERETVEGGPAALFRATVGDARPTKVADGIVAAAWVPGPTADPDAVNERLRSRTP